MHLPGIAYQRIGYDRYDRSTVRTTMERGRRRSTGVVLAGLVLVMQGVIAHRASAQIDPEDRMNLYAGGSINPERPGEGGSGAGYFYWNKLHWPCDDMQFRLIFSGPRIDTQLTWPHTFDEKTSFNIGLGGLWHFDDLHEFRDGRETDATSFYGSNVNSRVFLEREMFKVINKIPFNIQVGYDIRYNVYDRAAATADTFELPPDSLTQTVDVIFRLGGIKQGVVHREGIDVYLKLEAGWRTPWRQWGSVDDPYVTFSDFQKVEAGGSAMLPVGKFIPALQDNYIELQLTGAYGNHLDRLLDFKLGGSLPTTREPTTVHGFYGRELFASDYILVNSAYEFPIVKWHELAAHVYGDYALLRRDDIPDTRWHSFEGVGAGISAKVFCADVLLSYGYGINAQRFGHHGGHEIAVQMFLKF